MSNTILYNLPAGFPGTISRPGATTEQVVVSSSTPFSAFGLPGTIDATNNQFRPIQAGDTSVFGFLVRPFPTTDYNTADYGTFGASTPNPNTWVGDSMKRGYMTVKLAGGTASKNGTIYVRTAVGTSGKSIGDVEAAVTDTGNCIALPSTSYFTGPADSSGAVEIAFNI